MRRGPIVLPAAMLALALFPAVPASAASKCGLRLGSATGAPPRASTNVAFEIRFSRPLRSCVGTSVSSELWRRPCARMTTKCQAYSGPKRRVVSGTYRVTAADTMPGADSEGCRPLEPAARWSDYLPGCIWSVRQCIAPTAAERGGTGGWVRWWGRARAGNGPWRDAGAIIKQADVSAGPC